MIDQSERDARKIERLTGKNRRYNELAQIYAFQLLRTEAAKAGDMAQVAICDAAIVGDADARAECARVIAEAEAERQYQAQQEAAS